MSEGEILKRLAAFSGTVQAVYTPREKRGLCGSDSSDQCRGCLGWFHQNFISSDICPSCWGRIASALEQAAPPQLEESKGE